MTKILITGASGMVGSNIKKIINSKNNILFTPSSKELNLTNKKTTNQYLYKKKPDIIIHCAAIVGGILFNQQNQIKMLYENIEINNNLINAAYENNIKKLINFSSSCVYPNNSKKHKESEIFDGKYEKTNEGYALSKLISMKLCSFIKENKNYNYKTLIPCNLYGPGDTFNENKSHLISAAIMKIHNAKIKRSKSIKIWGTGKVKREFLYSEDLANFVNFTLKNYNKIPNFINVGTDTNLTVIDYYKLICSVLNYYPEFKFDTSKPDGVYQKKLDTKLQKNLKWKNKIGIKLGIKKTYEFYLKNYEKN